MPQPRAPAVISPAAFPAGIANEQCPGKRYNTTMDKEYEFTAEIKKVPDIDGAYIVFPYDLKKEFGKGRIKVHAEFDGEPYDGSIVNMGIKNKDGSICYILGIRKDIRQKINKNCGDKVRVKIKALI
jgi:hypothetical protein